MDMVGVMLKVIIQIVCTSYLYITPSTPTGYLTSIPASRDGILTTCVDHPVILTCSHDNRANGITRWIFSTPVDCTETIDHNPPIYTDQCGPFSFENVTEIGSSGFLNSTAVAQVNPSMSSTVIECRDSSGTVFNTFGHVSLCVVNYILGISVINEEEVVWERPTCAPEGALTFKVDVVRAYDREVVYMSITNNTSLKLSDAFETSINYTAIVTPIVGDVCSGCSTSINFRFKEVSNRSTTSALTTASSSTSQEKPRIVQLYITLAFGIGFVICATVAYQLMI